MGDWSSCGLKVRPANSETGSGAISTQSCGDRNPCDGSESTRPRNRGKRPEPMYYHPNLRRVSAQEPQSKGGVGNR